MTDQDYPPIDVSVAAHYLAKRSHPERDLYVFSYRVNIHNRGDKAARLLNRQWLITDGNGVVQEVSGRGVLGEQPLIAAGGEHSYDSWTVLPTQVGSMQGSYRMITEDGKEFSAEIPAFGLAVPGVLN